MASQEGRSSPEDLGKRFFSLRQKVRSRLLLGVLLKLELESPEVFEVWLAVKVHGQSYRAVAKKFGVRSTKTVFTRCNRGGERVRELLEGGMDALGADAQVQSEVSSVERAKGVDKSVLDARKRVAR